MTDTMAGRDLAQVIAEVARALQAQGDVEDTLQSMVDLAVSTVPGCEHAGVSMVSGGRITTPAASDDVPVQVDRIQYESDQGPCLDAIRDHEVFATGDLGAEQRWPQFSTRTVAGTGVRSMLSFRLFVESDTLGALNFYSRSTDAFGERSHLVGEVFAAHAAVALTGAREHEQVADLRQDLFDAQAQSRRHREQAAVAIALQRSMLTQLPEIDGVELAALYRPAARGHEVGGDWYDAFVLRDGSVALAVGDVTGHDIAAAATMGVVRNLLRGIAWDRLAPPSEVITRLDSAVQGLDVGALTTLVYGRLELKHSEHEDTDEDADAATHWQVTWTNAGHPPPLLLSGDGTVAVLREDPELLLGLREDTTRTDHVAALANGSTLLFYTDGLIERRGEHVTDGIERLARTIHHLAQAPLAEMLREAVDSLTGPNPGDDTAVLAVRVRP